MQVDLNSDLGESSDSAQLEREARVLDCVSSANIACGFHAGDPDLMRRTVRVAREKGVAIGAHPGFRGQEGFGRKEVRRSVAQIEDLVAYQVGALAGVAALEGARLSHVKPHGALYNMAARDTEVALAIAKTVKAIDPRLIVCGLAGSKLIDAAKRYGLTTAEEAFADRAYNPDGTLVSRDRPHAVIQEERAVIARTLSLAKDRLMIASDGQPMQIHADTICIHGDTPGSDRLALAIKQALAEAGIQVLPVGNANA